MELDEELCLCFHVTKRKVINFIRVEKPARPGQLSECFGAGTGCGWCRTYLTRLFEEAAGRPDDGGGVKRGGLRPAADSLRPRGGRHAAARRHADRRVLRHVRERDIAGARIEIKNSIAFERAQ